jgi:hypothetical protein
MNAPNQESAYWRLYKEQPLSDYGLSYFNELISEYRTLPLKDADPEMKAVAEEIIQKKTLTWGDIFTFEVVIMKLQPEGTLRRRAWDLQAKYRTLVGETAYDAYTKSNPPNPQTAELELVRADLLQLLNGFHWRYIITMAREKIRGRLCRWMAGVLGGVILIVAADATYHSLMGNQFKTPVFLVVLFMGMLGGFVSTQLRIQEDSGAGDPFEILTKLNNGWLSIFLSPISGAVFAEILYMMFAGGLLSGSLFPRISAPIDEAKSGLAFNLFAVNTGPLTGADFAKLIVWSFIAGFAERFVPDALDRIVASGNTPKKS